MVNNSFVKLSMMRACVLHFLLGVYRLGFDCNGLLLGGLRVEWMCDQVNAARWINSFK